MLRTCPLKGTGGQHPVEGTLSVGGDEYDTIPEIVSIPYFAYELHYLEKDSSQ